MIDDPAIIQLMCMVDEYRDMRVKLEAALLSKDYTPAKILVREMRELQADINFLTDIRRDLFRG